MSNAEEKKFTIAYVFKNAWNMESQQGFHGKTEMHYNVPWRIWAAAECNTGFAKLECLTPNGADDEWSIEAKIEMRLGKKHVEYMDVVFSELVNPVPLFIAKLFVNLKVEFHVTILKMSGIKVEKQRDFDDESARKFSDVVLKVKHQKFYVNKMYLASHSTYFKSFLLGYLVESGQSEIELKDIKPQDLQKFLELVYAESLVKDTTVVGILHLAKSFQSKTAYRRCEKFLMEYSKRTLKEKFHVALQYNLEKLKEKCMLEMKTAYNVVPVVPEKKVDVTVLKMSGMKIEWLRDFDDESARMFSDVVLKVKDQKFYVNKMYLASHSTYFESLFLGSFRESGQSEIELKDIDPQDLQNFLELVYAESLVEDTTVEGILHLADFFDAKTVTRRCDEFLKFEEVKLETV